jgi:hypothetical protein
MTPAPEPVVRLHHGTTRARAERILRTGPDPDYREPGESPDVRDRGFSTTVAGAPNRGLGGAEGYAHEKARNFPDQGGPAILEVDVPVWIVDLVRNHPDLGLAAETGEIRFVPPERRLPGVGLDELRAAWPGLRKRVIPL